MVFRKLFLTVLLMGGMTIAGCSGEGGSGNVADSSQPDAAASADAADTSSAAAPSDTDTTPKDSAASRPERTSLAGRWIFVLTDVVNEYPGLLLNVTPDGGDGKQVELLGTSPMMENFQLTSGSVNGNAIRLVLQPPQNAGVPDAQPIEFSGTLNDGVVLGEAQSGQGICIPAYLEATEEESLADYREPRQASGLREMREMRQTADIISQLRTLANNNTRSPFLFLIYQQILAMLADQDIPAADATAIVDEYLARADQWGPCLTQRALIQSAGALANAQYPSDVVLPYIERAEKAVADNKDASEGERQRVRLARGLALAGSESEEDYKQAREILTEFAEQAPFDTRIIAGLARAAETNGDTETALRRYAELAILPGMGGNRAPVERLWEELEKDPAELDAFLTNVYQDTVLAFADDKETSAPAPDQRVTLCELFTGGTCPPCVAADIATGALEATYPVSQLLVVRYHQNIPSADPLANADSEARFAYYNGEGTPTLAINGTVLPTGAIPMYGPVINAPEAYAALRGIIQREVEQTTNVVITLNANVVEGNQIRFDAEVSGLDDIPDTARLRFVLVEEQVIYPAPNGIRVHDMLVRAMPGGVAGIAPEEGALKYSDAILLDDLRTTLEEGVKQLEQRMARQFPQQPLALQDLRLIAFLQDDATRDILQATSVELSTEQAAATESADKAEPTTDAKPEAEKPAEKPAATDKPAEPEQPASGDSAPESSTPPAADEADAAESPAAESTSGDEA